jgi:plastocyanin
LRPRTLIGAGCAALLLVPALAHSQSQSSITAVDTPTPAWAPAAVTITAGESVEFRYAGTESHYLKFTRGPTAPSCRGVATAEKEGPWSGSCEFLEAGEYEFVCPLHHIPPYATMRGVVQVVAPTPTPSASATPPPGATATPAPSVTPAPGGQTALALKLSTSQRGTRVRGQVDVAQAASRLEVTLTARLATKRVRVGRTVKSAVAGAVAFSVKLDAKARRALRRRGRLEVTVAVTLTPPGGTKLVRSKRVRLRG